MNKLKDYTNALFDQKVLRDALIALNDNALNGNDAKQIFMSLYVEFNDERWTYDNLDEFFSAYTKDSAWTGLRVSQSGAMLDVETRIDKTTVSVSAQSRSSIEAVFSIFEQAIAASNFSRVSSKSKKPVVFIGHGHSTQWRDLKDHLTDKHEYPVEAYEVGARAGHTIRDILNDMLGKSHFACLIMTGEDQVGDGTLRARQNVIHEIGLFQGRLGFTRAVVLLEEGTDEFSNLHGIQQIRFSKENIRETFGDVLATLKREFGESS